PNVRVRRLRGGESEVEYRPAKEWRFLASYLFSDTRVLDAPQQKALEGNRLAQVPEHTFTLGARFAHPAWFTAGVQVRGRSVRGRPQHVAAGQLHRGGPHDLARLREVGRAVRGRGEPVRPDL